MLLGLQETLRDHWGTSRIAAAGQPTSPVATAGPRLSWADALKWVRRMEQPDRRKMRVQWRAHKLMWNLSGGRMGRKVSGIPVLELVAIGHKSGQDRQVLIFYIEDEGAPAIVGTNAGMDADPAWVKNLRANPDARARWDGAWHDVTAVELSGSDHDRVWAEAVAASSMYANYAKVLTRPIPIIRLESR